MASTWTSFLFLGFVTTLEFTSGAKITSSRCRCLITDTSRPMVSCYDLHDDCANSLLAEFSADHPESGIDLFLYDTDLDRLPDSFLAPYTVSGLTLTRCTMTSIPHRLINPACPFLTSVNIFDSNISDATIPEGGFQRCTGLKFLMIQNSGIRNLSSKAFLGLSNLTLLTLKGNGIQTFTGFQGIENVRHLDLSRNWINSVDKDAFRGLSKLTLLDLSHNKLTTLPEGVFDPFTGNKGAIAHLQGNPLHCNCSLKWLQDWLGLHSSGSSQLQCAAPMIGSLMTFDFCSHAKSQRPKADGSLTELLGLFEHNFLLALSNLFS